VVCDVCMCDGEDLLTHTILTLFIYTTHYNTILYNDIHIFTYTTIISNIHIHYTITLQYIKELHNNNAFNTQQKVLNNRICYTDYIMNLHYYLNSLNI